MNFISIEEQKRIALDILLTFAEFCEKHKLRYFLGYGTLLGAVRHKGFIPWDDDIDVVMPRVDYEKLMLIFKGHPYYKAMNIDIDPNYGKLFGVINDTRTKKIERLTRRKCNDTVCVNIDIFPIDYLPDNSDDQQELLSKIRSIENKIACLTYSFGKGRNVLTTIRKNIGIALLRLMSLFNIITIKKLKRQHTNLLSKYNKENKTAGSVTNTGFYGIKEFMPKEYFEDAILMEFEGHKLRCPKEFDKILSHIYGNYMELPPIEKRISHHENNCVWK